MMNRLADIFRILILLVILMPENLLAGRGDKAGTAAAPELLIPIGARSIGLGGAMLATIGGVEAIYWNPAGLASQENRYGLIFSHMKFFGNIDVGYFAAGITIQSVGSLGLSVKSLDVGDIMVTTEDQPDGTGEITSPTFLTVGGTFSRRISDRISLGVTGNLVYEKMARVSATTIAFTAGVQYRGIGGIDGLSIGVAVKNIGPPLKFDGTGLLREARIADALEENSIVKIEAAASDLPSTIEVGLGYGMSVHEDGELMLVTTFQNNNYSDDEYKFGGEYRYQNFFSVRSGISLTSESDNREFIFGPSFGIGIHKTIGDAAISVDYAFRTVEYFSANHVFSIILNI